VTLGEIGKILLGAVKFTSLPSKLIVMILSSVGLGIYFMSSKVLYLPNTTQFRLSKDLEKLLNSIKMIFSRYSTSKLILTFYLELKNTQNYLKYGVNYSMMYSLGIEVQALDPGILYNSNLNHFIP
jgi:hypothetical protein